MLWGRLSVSGKLFIIIGAVSALVVVFMALMITVNMRSGFAQYLAQAELARFDALEERLAQLHDVENPGWPSLKGDRAAWHRLVRSTIPPPPGTEPFRRLEEGREAGASPSRPRDPMRLGSRLALLDALNEFVVGGNEENSVFAKRPIGQREGVANPIGWIALTAVPARMAEGDRLFLADQIRTLAATAALALLLSAAAAFVFSRQFLRPVQAIAQAGEQLARGNYSIRLQNARSDELGSLIEQFNDLAETLDNAERTERKWVADTAHELKTPVAVLQAQIEALQDGVRKPDRNSLSLLHASTERLSKLVADLNTLTATGEGAMPIEPRHENLSVVLEQAAEAIRPALVDQDLTLRTDIPSDLDIVCDRLRIGQLIDNLLQNARLYTKAPGVIRMQAERKGKTVVIRVEDSPPAPQSEDMPKLFDRFFRCEQSRDRRYGGSGLGLSICREIVQAHGGTIEAKRSPLGGLAMIVSLPAGGVQDV